MSSKEALENWYSTQSPATKAYEYELHYHIFEVNIDIRPLSTFVSCKGCSFYEDIKKGKPIVSNVCYYCNNSPIKIGD